MLGASGIQARRDAGEIEIDPYDEARLGGTGYDIAASGEYYRLADLDRPINPLQQDTVADAVQAATTTATGEIEVGPNAPVTILSAERIAVDRSLTVVPETHPSLQRLGLTVRCDPDGIGHPDGPDAPTRLACTVSSTNPTPVILHPGQPILRLRFVPVDDPDPEWVPRVDAALPRPAFDDLPADLVTNNLCIGITGLAASGKSESAAILADVLAAESYGMGEVIRAEADRRGLEQNGENLNRVSQELRAEHGQGIVAERLLDRIDRDAEANVRIIEGIRGPAEVEVFRRELPDAFFLLGIHASRDTRIDRLGTRGRSDDAGGAETLATRDEKESGFGLREAIGMSDYIITNEGSMAELEREIERVAARICHRYG